MISINTVCQNVRHKGNFEICRPDGSGDDLLVIFKTSAVLIQNGEEITVSPDSLILYSKGTMQHYKTLCGSYVNHFVHFDTDDTELMNGIKTDTLITSVDIPAIEESLTRADLYIADEMFMTGSAAELTPVASVDDREVGKPGPITKALQERYFDVAYGKVPEYEEWITRIAY